MNFFYAIKGNSFARDRYYKVYIKQKELWLGQIGRQLYGMQQLGGNSIILELVFSSLRRWCIVPRGKKREQALDAILSSREFLMRKGNRIISFDDLAEVTINELQSLHTIHGNSGTLTLKLVDGKEFKLVLEENTSLKQLEAIFHQIPVKRIDYWW